MEMRRLGVELTDEDQALPHDVAPVAPPIAYLFGAAEPEDATDSGQSEIRYERGSTVYALDGPVGSLRQVVIDEGEAEVKALVVREATKGESVLVPPDLVDKSVGTALFLNVNKEQFLRGAARSPRFDARMFTAADAKSVARMIPGAFRGNKQRSVVNLTRSCLVTSEVLDRPGQSSPAARQSKWASRPWNRSS
jgi:hypothetical protein